MIFLQGLELHAIMSGSKITFPEQVKRFIQKASFSGLRADCCEQEVGWETSRGPFQPELLHGPICSRSTPADSSAPSISAHSAFDNEVSDKMGLNWRGSRGHRLSPYYKTIALTAHKLCSQPGTTMLFLQSPHFLPHRKENPDTPSHVQEMSFHKRQAPH